MNIKKERKKADDLYQKFLSFFEVGEFQDGFRVAADSMLLYTNIYRYSQKEDYFEIILKYLENFIIKCVTSVLFRTETFSNRDRFLKSF
ncbi:hypothetical protein LCGC14_1821980 [marine sediment metagenome]|uniref:Uncharacterized protein n=1 Tax=marine sediment metagenome TaxID=412755 RepID=A0A0F9GIQ3_9ZZZZ